MEKVLELLEELKESPITNEDYYITTENLCSAINTIAGDIGGLIEEVKMLLKNNKNPSPHFLEWSIERTWQIQSISEIIKNRLQHEDFTDFCNLIYHYKE